MSKSCDFFFQAKNETYILSINKPNIMKNLKIINIAIVCIRFICIVFWFSFQQNMVTIRISTIFRGGTLIRGRHCGRQNTIDISLIFLIKELTRFSCLDRARHVIILTFNIRQNTMVTITGSLMVQICISSTTSNIFQETQVKQCVKESMTKYTKLSKKMKLFLIIVKKY